jgi:magnesium transporter
VVAAEEAMSEPQERLSAKDLRDIWSILSPSERLEGFHLLSPDEADDFFLSLSPLGQAAILEGLPQGERRLWIRVLPPDDAADLLQHVSAEARQALLALLDDPTRREVSALLAYAEDEAGGLMSPRFARIRADMTVDEAIAYLRRQARVHLETIYYAYVLDSAQKLLGVVSFRELFAASGERLVRDVMHSPAVSVPENMDQEEVARAFAEYGFLAIPVVDAEGHMKGIVTVDDIVDVVEEEATEDIQKLGGMQALETPYMQTSVLGMLRKRAVWLVVLFLGEMLTANAMSHFEDDIAAAVVLALFVPLIISSGGNAGSQGSTLVIRALALGEVQLRDWWRVVRRELATGLALGGMLAGIGFLRIVGSEVLFGGYGEHYALVAITVGLSLVAVVTWGALIGSTLPLLLRRVGLDPASASAPLVATLSDVFGLVIYFSVAQQVLRGTLL